MSMVAVQKTRLRGILISILPLVTATTAIAADEKAKGADGFVDIIGVNGHLNYENSVYLDKYHSIILPRARELGIRNWRDALSWSDTIASRQLEMASHGIRFNLGMHELDTVVLLQHLRKVLPAVQAIEGPNELDHGFRDGKPAYPDASTRIYKGLSYPAIVPAIQNDLYKAIKGNADTRHLKVVMAGFSFPDNVLDVGLVQGADYGNTHSYPDGGPPVFRLDDWYIPRMRVNVGPDKPLIATETGYHNATGTGAEVGHWISAVSERAAAKYQARLFFEYFNRGFVKVYLYEFIDSHPNAPFAEGAFGLLRNDGTPKTQFLAIKNLISGLKDPGSPIIPGSFDYGLEGDTAQIRHTLLQKRDGSFLLCLWLNGMSYDKATRKDLEPKRALRVVFGKPLESAEVYLPLVSAAASAKSTSPAFLDLQIPDHPLVLRLLPKNPVIPSVAVRKQKRAVSGPAPISKPRLHSWGQSEVDLKGRVSGQL